MGQETLVATTITGVQGTLWWSHYAAATLHPWTLVRDGGVWTLTATVVTVDAYRASQRPLTFVTPNGCRWPVIELQMTGVSLTAMLGPMESVHVPIRETADRPPAA